MKKIPIIAVLLFAMILIMSACTLPPFDVGHLISTLIPDNRTAVVCPTCEASVICETSVVVLTDQPAPTDTPTETLTPTEEPTTAPDPTETPEPTLTNTPTPTNTPVPVVYPYILQPGSPVYIDNVFHPEAGAEWMGIGGQVFNSQGEPQPLVVIHVDGMLEGTPVQFVSMTGVARFLGPEGYEVELANHGIDSQGSLTITLFDLAGEQISAAVHFDTFSAPNKAQIIINFIQNK